VPAKKATEKAAATRARSRARGAERKAERIKAQNERHAANVAAGKTPRHRVRRANNMRMCLRCKYRMIVAGSVCWCRSIGENKSEMSNGSDSKRIRGGS
jgi:hypothetical protein